LFSGGVIPALLDDAISTDAATNQNAIGHISCAGLGRDVRVELSVIHRSTFERITRLWKKWIEFPGPPSFCGKLSHSVPATRTLTHTSSEHSTLISLFCPNPKVRGKCHHSGKG